MLDIEGPDAARLRTLKHIVVLMMENRSFDHMLGYLKLEGMGEVEGLTGTEFNLDRDGKPVLVHAFDAESATLQRHGEALQKRLDPDHGVAGVKVQLGMGYSKATDARNHGFVKSFIESRKPDDQVGPDLWGVPMGYYTSKDVPVYDHLARQYCLCDHWYASIPGDTWPNRLYAVAGRLGPNISETSDLWDAITNLPPLKRLKGAPVFDRPAFTRRLGDDQWRWYSHDPGILRLIDGAYRDLGDLKRDNFAFFDRRKVDWITETLAAPIVRAGSFLDDAARNDLPQVSWIDPNFVDVSVRETLSNDDHPPSDIRAGQALVLDIYEALRKTREWDDTLLVVAYDEHGGFFDHVPPPQLPPEDEARQEEDRFETYGVRVPALIAGPRVRKHVLGAANDDGQPQFDHTTLIKTILLAFADDPRAAVAAMPGRVQRAPHLGGVLLDEPRTDIDEPRNQRSLMETWRQAARRRREAEAVADGAAPSAAPDGAGHPIVLTDFQAEFQSVAAALRRLGIDA